MRTIAHDFDYSCLRLFLFQCEKSTNILASALHPRLWAASLLLWNPAGTKAKKGKRDRRAVSCEAAIFEQRGPQQQRKDAVAGTLAARRSRRRRSAAHLLSIASAFLAFVPAGFHSKKKRTAHSLAIFRNQIFFINRTERHRLYKPV